MARRAQTYTAAGLRSITCVQVGKKMHPSPDQRAEMLQRFEEECELLSRLIRAGAARTRYA